MNKKNAHHDKESFFFKVLGHPARIEILKYLAESTSCISGDFSFRLSLSRTTIAQHLNVLKKAGLLKWHTEGVKTYYCLNKEGIQKHIQEAQLFFDIINNDTNIDCTK